MKLLPIQYASAWVDSESQPGVRFQVQTMSKRQREWAQARNQRWEPAEYQALAYEVTQPVVDGPYAGKLAVTDTYGVALDQVRAAVIGLEGIEGADGQPWSFETEKVRFMASSFEVMSEDSLNLLMDSAMVLVGEMIRAAAAGAELSPAEAEGVGFTSDSAQPE